MGTPSYMAPEQARGEVEPIDERADVFALGSILCEILTGQPAFTGRTSGEIQRKASRGDLADAFDRLGACGADADVVSLARDCLAAEPEDRPREADKVTARVTAYLTGVQEKLRAAELATVASEARAEEAGKRADVERSQATASARPGGSGPVAHDSRRPDLHLLAPAAPDPCEPGRAGAQGGDLAARPGSPARRRTGTMDGRARGSQTRRDWRCTMPSDAGRAPGTRRIESRGSGRSRGRPGRRQAPRDAGRHP